MSTSLLTVGPEFFYANANTALYAAYTINLPGNTYGCLPGSKVYIRFVNGVTALTVSSPDTVIGGSLSLSPNQVACFAMWDDTNWYRLY